MLNIYNTIAGGANTGSKQAHRYPANYPDTIIKGSGAYIYDYKNISYLDMMCSLGANILGHRFKPIDSFVVETIKQKGNIFSLKNNFENKLGLMLKDMIPSCEQVRLLHNGKDATEAAIRLARGITGKELVLSFSYHGAVDTFLAASESDKGVPECLKKLCINFDYNDISHVNLLFRKYGYNIACIILEPHTIRMPNKGFLKELRTLCNKYKTLLIFDEMVSFPRYLKYSAQAYFNVMPDLTCIGKGMANGYAISALVGKKKHMKHLVDGDVFVSTTHGGNLIGVSAAMATLEFIKRNKIPEYLDDLGLTLKTHFKENSLVKLTGLNCRQFLDTDDITRQIIWQEAIKRGIFMGVPIFFNYSMTRDDIIFLANELNDIILKIQKKQVKLKGRKIKEIFKKK